MRTFLLEKGKREVIARAGESGGVAIAINVTKWLQDWPDGVPGLLCERPDAQRLPVSCGVTDNLLIAELPPECLRMPGVYEYTATWTQNGELKVSERYEPIVLVSPFAGGDPDPRRTPDWAREIYIQAEQIKTALNGALQMAQYAVDAEKARDDAQAAQLAAETAQGAAEDAKEASEEALANVQQIIDDGQQTISEMQAAADGIEAQRQTMIESIASVAGQGTDTTLTQSGVAADAKATGDAVGELKSAIDSIIDSQYLTLFSQNTISGTRYISFPVNIPSGNYQINIGNIVSSDTDDTQSLIMFNNGNTAVLQLYADRVADYSADIVIPEDVNTIWFFAAKTYNSSAGDTFTFSNVVVTNPDNQLNNRLTETEKTKTTVDNTMRTRNLFNVATYTEKKQFNGQGVIIDSELTGISDYIPVESGRKVYFSKDGRPYKKWDIAHICEYDTQKTFIQRIDSIAADYVYTVPSNVAYIRICILDSLANVWQCEYDGITGYVPYYLYDAIDYIDNGVLMATVNMFGSIAGIGDSYTAGSSQISGGTMVDMTNQSYIATMGKRAGVDWYNYGVGGATVGSYLVNANGLPKVLAANPHDLYIINLGQNDVNQVVTIGSIADINDSDYTQNPDTFYGNYGKLIAQLKAHAPNAKIILVKSWIDGKSWNHNIDYQSYDPAIQEIAEHYGFPCIAPFDDRLFRSYFYSHYKLNGHPTPMGYTAQGLAMERLFSRCVLENPEYFIDATVT